MNKLKNRQNETGQSKVSVFCGHAIEGLWLFLLIALPLFYYRSHQSFNMPKTQLLCIIVSFMIVFWLVKGLEERKFDFRWGATGFIMLGYFLILVISTIFGDHPAVSWWGSYTRFEGLSAYLFYIASFFIIFWNLKSFDQIKRIFICLGLTMLPVSIYGLFQYFGYDFLKFTGTTGHSFKAIISTMGNQLFLSDYLIMVIPVSVALIFYSKNIYWRLFWLASGGLGLWALILTARRAGFVALVAIVLFGAFLFMWRWKKSLSIALIAIILISGAIFYFNFEKITTSDFVQENEYFKRMATIFDLEEGSIKQRLLVWGVTKDMILQRPIIGHGLETFKYVFDLNYPPYFTEMPENYFDRAHNFVLDKIFTNGILGAGLLFTLIGLAMFSSIKFFLKKNIKQAYFGWAVAVSLVGFLTHNFFSFESAVSRYYLFVLIAVGTSLFVVLQNKISAEEEVEEKLKNNNHNKIKFWAVPEYKIIYYAFLIIALGYAVKFHVFPIAGDFYYNRTVSYTRLEHREKREELFKKAMYYIKDVRSSIYYRMLGSDYFITAQNAKPEYRDKYFKESIEWYSKAAEKDSLEFTNYNEPAQVYMVWATTFNEEAKQTEKINQGNELFSQALELSPGRQMIYWDWGRSLIHAGLVEEGLDKYEYAVEMDPSVGRSHFYLGKAYRDTNQPEKARAAFDKARELGFKRGQETDPLAK